MILPKIYDLNQSCSRPVGSVRIRHCWWAEHTRSIGSFNANEIFDKLIPIPKNGYNAPSKTINDYDIPKPLPEWESKNIIVKDLVDHS